MSGDMFGTAEFKEISFADAFQIPIHLIEDAQRFITPPVGLYKFKVSVSKDTVGKGDNQKEAIVTVFEVVDTIELANPQEEKVKPGSLVGRNYTAGSGVQHFVTEFREVMVKMGLSTLPEACDKIKDVLVKAMVTHTTDKDDKSKKYAQIGNISLVQ